MPWSAVFGGSRGTLTIAGGTAVLSSALTVGRDTSATGAVTVAGGNLFVTNAAGTATLLVGQSGRGIYVQNGGTLTVDRPCGNQQPKLCSVPASRWHGVP